MQYVTSTQPASETPLSSDVRKSPPAALCFEWLKRQKSLMAQMTVIIPAFNEEAYIGETLRQVSSLNCSIIVVNDGSTDRTGSIARECEGAYVLDLPENRGKGHAVKMALELVKTPYVALQDADLEYSPLSLRYLMERCDCDMVIGTREISVGSMSVTSFVANKIFQTLLRSPDPFSGQRVMRTDFLRSMGLSANRFEIETEITIKARRAGAAIKYFSIPYTPRTKCLGKKIGFVDFLDISNLYIRENFSA